MAEELCVHLEALRGWIRQTEAGADERDDLLTTEGKDELTLETTSRQEMPGYLDAQGPSFGSPPVGQGG
ncbi:hypothetical protein ACFVU0_14535 [Streptomyces sp. NPDC058122]|uniref:hypothetical protein n=1 Tax=Streptomyces sp. NPDC058122 TaxID=3346349 RepID=UPI0036EE35EF